MNGDFVDLAQLLDEVIGDGQFFILTLVRSYRPTPRRGCGRFGAFVVSRLYTTGACLNTVPIGIYSIYMYLHVHILFAQSSNSPQRRLSSGFSLVVGVLSFLGRQLLPDGIIFSLSNLFVNSDAVGFLGFSAIQHNSWFARSWPPPLSSASLTVLELFPIVATTHVCG